MIRKVWTRKQKKQLLHDLKSNIYNECQVIKRWVKSCDNTGQLQNIIYFINDKVNQYHIILDNTFIVFWYSNAIYGEVREFLFECIKDIEELHNDMVNELKYIEELNNKKPPVIIKGFCDNY